MRRCMWNLALAMGLPLCLATNAMAAVSQTVQKAEDAAAGDGFGWSVANDDTFYVVGAPFDTNGEGIQAGAVYIYWFDQSWVEQKVTCADQTSYSRCGISVSISGDLIVVGCPIHNSNSGMALIMRWDEQNGEWTCEEMLVSDDVGAGDHFGTAVAISEMLVVVGAPDWDYSEQYQDTGKVYVFDGNDSWAQVDGFYYSNVSEAYGEAVDIDASGEDLYIVVGARLSDTAGTDAGAAYAYSAKAGSPDSWSLMDSVTGQNAGDQFGSSVSVSTNSSGVFVAVGAPRWDYAGGYIDTGRGYIYIIDPPALYLADYLDSKREAYQYFGTDVHIDGEWVIVGSPGEDYGVSNSGRADVYHRYTNQNWPLKVTLDPPTQGTNDIYGASVSIYGPPSVATAAVGIPYDDDPTDSGAISIVEGL